MGLEVVELILDVEATFNISVSDEEAASANTVGKLVDLIFLKVSHASDTDSKNCFQKLRIDLSEILKIDPLKIEMEARLESLIPRKSRKQYWTAIANNLSAGKPYVYGKLKPPSWYVCLVFLIIFLILIFVASFASLLEFLFIATPAALAVYAILYGLFRTEIPGAFKQVSDLLAVMPRESWTRGDVEFVVKRLVVETLGVEESEVNNDSRFIEDLGAG